MPLRTFDWDGARRRVDAHKVANPSGTVDGLARALIRRKCRHVAAVSTLAAGASVVPGVGVWLSSTLGVASDLAAVLRLQIELITELAVLYGCADSGPDFQRNVLLLTGLSAGGNRMLYLGGRQVSTQLARRIARQWLCHALPVAGIAVATGANVLWTYAIGKRAQRQFARASQTLARPSA